MVMGIVGACEVGAGYGVHEFGVEGIAVGTDDNVGWGERGCGCGRGGGETGVGVCGDYAGDG